MTKADLLRENAALTAKFDQEHEAYADIFNQLSATELRESELKASNARLRETLEHYANRDNWLENSKGMCAYRGTIWGPSVADTTLAETPAQSLEAIRAEEPVVYSDIKVERNRQDAQWGGIGHDDDHDWQEWRKFIHYQLSRLNYQEVAGKPTVIRQRYVKVAALAVAAIESIDRKKAIQSRGDSGAK